MNQRSTVQVITLRHTTLTAKTRLPGFPTRLDLRYFLVVDMHIMMRVYSTTVILTAHCATQHELLPRTNLVSLFHNYDRPHVAFSNVKQLTTGSNT